MLTSRTTERGIQSTWQRLDALWRSPSVPNLPLQNQRYVLFSDLHLGDGGRADDFFHNREALVQALDHYRRLDYRLILLGDTEELWQFDLPKIVQTYGDSVYSMIRQFGDERVIRVFGNHDLEWSGWVDPIRNTIPPNVFAPEALRLYDGEGVNRFLLVHGHQGSLESDAYIWFSRFFVRLYTFLEPVLRRLGIVRNPSTAKSQIAKDYERMLYIWAKRNRVILICGHSHRAIFAAKSYAERLEAQIILDRTLLAIPETSEATRAEIAARLAANQKKLANEKKRGRVMDPLDPTCDALPVYFNTGCGLYREGITAIEIDHDEIRLVKWSSSQAPTEMRQVYHEGKISQFIQAVQKGSTEDLA